MYKLLILVSSMLILGVACSDAPQEDNAVVEQTIEVSEPAIEVVLPDTSPEAAFNAFIEAMKNGDAQTIIEFYPSEALFQMEMQLEQIKTDTTGQIALAFAQMGINVTPEELQNWTAVDMVEAQITSPMMQGQFDGVSVVGSTVEGETAIVEIEMFIPEMDTTIVTEAILILEDGQWKMGQGF